MFLWNDDVKVAEIVAWFCNNLNLIYLSGSLHDAYLPFRVNNMKPQHFTIWYQITTTLKKQSYDQNYFANYE